MRVKLPQEYTGKEIMNAFDAVIKALPETLDRYQWRTKISVDDCIAFDKSCVSFRPNRKSLKIQEYKQGKKWVFWGKLVWTEWIRRIFVDFLDLERMYDNVNIRCELYISGEPGGWLECSHNQEYYQECFKDFVEAMLLEVFNKLTSNEQRTTPGGTPCAA